MEGPAAWHHYAEQPAQRERWGAQIGSDGSAVANMVSNTTTHDVITNQNKHHKPIVWLGGGTKLLHFVPPMVRAKWEKTEPFPRNINLGALADHWSGIVICELVGTCSFCRIPSLKISGKLIHVYHSLSISVLFFARLPHKSLNMCTVYVTALLRLLAPKSFHLYHHIPFTCCFISSHFVTLLSHSITFHHIRSHSITCWFTYVYIYTIYNQL